MKINASADLDNVLDFDALKRFTTIAFKQVIDCLNGNVDVVDNLRIRLVNATFSAANTDTQINHGLGRSPNGYILAGASGNFTIFNGSQGSSADLIYLQASAAGSAKILFF